MTTIAYCGNKLASDSQATMGNRKVLGSTQKLFIPHTSESWKVQGSDVQVIGFAGSAQFIPWAIEQLTKGLFYNDLPKAGGNLAKQGGFQVLIVTKDKEVFCWEYNDPHRENGYYNALHIETGPTAIGSGSAYAAGLLSIGGNAVDAVAAAIKNDIKTSGDIQVYSFDTPGELSVLKASDPAREELRDAFYGEATGILNGDNDLSDHDRLKQLRELFADDRFKGLFN